MRDSQRPIALAVTLLFAASAGCSKPAPVPTRPVSASPAAASTCASCMCGSCALAEAPSDADTSVRPAARLVAFEDSAEPKQEAAQEPGQEAAPRREPAADDAEHFTKRMLSFVVEARAAAALLETHGSTASFDQQCAKLKDLLERARSADEDDGFDAATQHANLILQQLRLGRLYLRQRDELDGLRSPGAIKLLGDTYQACSRLAREEQQEIADLRREVDTK